MASYRARWLALIGLSLACPAAAAAHGGDARIVRVAAVDASGAPWLVQLTEGLALRDAQTWRFVCPAALEASVVLHALSADGQTAWAATLRDVFRLAPNGTLERARGCGDYPLKLLAHAGGVTLLARDSARDGLVVCSLEPDGPREIYASDVAFDDLASDGSQLWLARGMGDVLELEAIGSGERRSYALTAQYRALRLSAAGGSLYATLIDSERSTLLRLGPEGAEPLLESDGPLDGPIEAGGSVYAAQGGRLMALEGEEPFALEAALVVDQVDGIAGRGFAFAGGALYALPLSGTSSPEALFSLDGLSPPASVASDECSVQWRRFELDLHAPDHALEPGAQAASDASAPPERDAGAGASQPRAAMAGCSAGGFVPASSRHLPAAFLMCVLLVALRAAFRR